MSGIYWLASYPKSGNTWLRLAIQSLRRDGAEVDINQSEERAPIASARSLVDRVLDVETSDLTVAEAERARPKAYERLSRDADTSLVLKVHDAWTMISAGEPLFPPAATAGALYVVRDPRDVAVSLAHHLDCSIDAAIDHMANAAYAFAPSSRFTPQFPQRLLTWSGHVSSWLDATGIQTLTVRYEDMSADLPGVLAEVARFMGMQVSPDALMRAVDATRFDRLRAQEDRHGFQEKHSRMSAFFRRGVAGGWRDSLSAAQAARVVHDHERVMQRLGYRP